MGLYACASGPLIVEPRSNHAFSQAFYYAIFSAGPYFLVAILMLITAWGAYKGHYDKEFQLTLSQRTPMLQIITFLVYLLASAAVYSHIEGWKFFGAVYWADFALLAVGIGDYSPAAHLGRGLLFPFAIGGIIVLGSRNRFHPLSRLGTRKSKNEGPDGRKRASTLAQTHA